MEFSSLSTVGNPESSFFLLFLFFFSSPHISLPVLLPLLTYPLSRCSSSPHMYHIGPFQQLFNRQFALVFLCPFLWEEGERLVFKKLTQRMTTFQPRYKTIDSKHKTEHSNYKKDWDLLLDPSLTLSCWGPDYYDSGWGVGKQSSCPVWRKWLKMESGDHTWVNQTNSELIIDFNWIK